MSIISILLFTFAPDMEQKRKNNGGRPHTDRTNRKNIKLSDEAIALLASCKNKSAFIDALIRGEAAQIKCPDCGKIFTIKNGGLTDESIMGLYSRECQRNLCKRNAIG